MIAVEHLTKKFKLYKSPADRLKEIILHRRYHREFTALNEVSFTIRSGEILGIVGQNGAGKSTLLKLLMGILLPDGGTIGIEGRITGLLELTTGFNYEFTGVQNIYLNAALRGMSRQEADAKLGQIVAFSELGDFIQEPIKTYSSGMVMRLAFSIAIHAEPQAFVVDEALSVGDAYFQQKCMKRIMEFKEKGGAIVFVSHDLNAIKLLSDKALLLDHGQVIETGDPDSVINSYNFLLAKKSEGQEIIVRTTSNKVMAYGNFKVEITGVKMLNANGQDCDLFTSGEKCIIRVLLHAHENTREITVGILIRDKFGQDVFGTNTHYLNVPLNLESGETCAVEYDISELNIGPGKYTLTVAAHTLDTHIHECYHWADVVKSFEVVANRAFIFSGLLRLKPEVRVQKNT
jgi:lipopolysaccharide transport system ATP-binding protein